MSTPFEVSPPKDDDERTAFARMFMLALVGSIPPGDEWITSARERVFGQGETRVVREDGALVGGLALFDFGQFWGGRSLRCAGVSVVAIAPEARGRGAARALLEESLREARAMGRPISALYPATNLLYRKTGYELAGTGLVLRVPLHRFEIAKTGLAMRAFRPDDLDSIRAMYTGRALTHDGWLDRSEAYWRHRIFETYQGPSTGVVMHDGGRIEGYLFYRQKPLPSGHYDLVAVDLCANTPRGWAQIETFVAGNRSMAEGLVYRSGAHQLPFGAFSEVRDITVERRLDWMLRILDVQGAIAGRGYLPGLRGEARFGIRDPMIPENAGPWHVRVEDGHAVIDRCARADVTLDARGLATLYSGYHSAHDVSMLGLAEGDSAELERVANLFAGRPPGLPDMF